MNQSAINFEDKFRQFEDQWQPRIIAEANNYRFKLAKIQGSVSWHSHTDKDEVFIVMDGSMIIKLRAGEVELNSGEMFVVKRGVEHSPYAENECRLLLVEPANLKTVGSPDGVPVTVEDVWI